jgi:glycosyltransferase involved in cell wall biosynthesis
MPRPLVSVVIPMFDAERFIAETLESVLAQSYRPIEVIAVDDGSTDGTAEVVGAFPEVICIHQENRGPAAARNAGIALAQGEFVATVDADDVVPPHKLDVQVAYLLDNPDVSCVLGRQEWDSPPSWLGRDPVWGDLDGIPLVSMVIRTDVLRGLGGYDETLRGPEDFDLFVRLREAGHKHVVLPDVVLTRRYHGDNLVAGRDPHDQTVQLLKAKLDRERGQAERTT